MSPLATLPPVDVVEAIRAHERRRIAALIRDEARALTRYRADGGNPTTEVSPRAAAAVARFIEANA